jgi:hypothetical protein
MTLKHCHKLPIQLFVLHIGVSQPFVPSSTLKHLVQSGYEIEVGKADEMQPSSRWKNETETYLNPLTPNDL